MLKSMEYNDIWWSLRIMNVIALACVLALLLVYDLKAGILGFSAWAFGNGAGWLERSLKTKENS
jgi:hypothetical protein